MGNTTVMQGARERHIRLVYRIGILLKGIDGAIELLAGVGMLLVTGPLLAGIVDLVTRHELSEDPQDWIANALAEAAHRMSGDTRHFAAAYLLGHGVVKVLLAVSLWREKSWAYPLALFILGLFCAYQAYRFAHTHSLVLLAFTAVDVFIMWAIWREYRLKAAMGAIGKRRWT